MCWKATAQVTAEARAAFVSRTPSPCFVLKERRRTSPRNPTQATAHRLCVSARSPRPDCKTPSAGRATRREVECKKGRPSKTRASRCRQTANRQTTGAHGQSTCHFSGCFCLVCVRSRLLHIFAPYSAASSPPPPLHLDFLLSHAEGVWLHDFPFRFLRVPACVNARKHARDCVHFQGVSLIRNAATGYFVQSKVEHWSI